MALYYIEAVVDDVLVLYTLDATTDIVYTLNSHISSHPVEEGSDVSDNILNQNKTVSLTGYISDIKSVSSSLNLPTKDYIEGLEKVRENKTLFTLFIGGQLVSIQNCFFESITITQDGENGSLVSGLKTVSSFKVSLAMKQLRLVESALITTRRADEIKDITQDKKDVSGATSFADPLVTSESLEERGRAQVEDGFYKVAGG